MPVEAKDIVNLLLDKNTQLVDELRRLRARNNELEGLTKIERRQLKERKNLFFGIIFAFYLAFVLVIISKCI